MFTSTITIDEEDLQLMDLAMTCSNTQESHDKRLLETEFWKQVDDIIQMIENYSMTPNDDYIEKTLQQYFSDKNIILAIEDDALIHTLIGTIVGPDDLYYEFENYDMVCAQTNVIKYLLNNGATVEQITNCDIHNASIRNPYILKLMIEHDRININWIDHEGKTLLQLVTEHYNYEGEQYLLQMGITH